MYRSFPISCNHNFYNSLSCSTFPTGMKYTDVTPIYQKDDKTDKRNYFPINILPNLSKVYEGLMYNQIDCLSCFTRVNPRTTFIQYLYL